MAGVIVYYVRRAVLITAAAGACYGLAERFGVWPAALIWAVAAGAACALGAVLLRTSDIGRVTWRNRTAGYLIPWGWRLNRGRLLPAVVISWLVWLGIGAAALLLRPGEEQPGIGIRVGLFVAWVVDAAALMFVLGSIRQATPGGRVGSLWKLVSVIAVVLGASVCLHFGGLSTAALVVGGGPPAVLAGGAALFVGFMMTVGRNTRWN